VSKQVNQKVTESVQKDVPNHLFYYPKTFILYNCYWFISYSFYINLYSFG